jgi:hypothetical protein
MTARATARQTIARWYSWLRDRLAGDSCLADAERGDVPGWVLITVMTAGMVTALWLLAEPQLKGFLQSALNAVHGP